MSEHHNKNAMLKYMFIRLRGAMGPGISRQARSCGSNRMKIIRPSRSTRRRTVPSGTRCIWSSPRRICSSDDGASISPSAPTTRRVGGPFATGVPCNPETSVTRLASMTDLASSCLRVANKHVHIGIHGIMAVATELRGGGCGTSTFHANMSCWLCFMEALCEQRRRELAGMPLEMLITEDVRT